MSSEHLFDEKGKARAKPSRETAAPQKGDGAAKLPPAQGQLDASTLTHMQQTMGNAAVQRFLAQRSGEGTAEVDEETAAAIQSKRGEGHSLDEEMAAKAGDVMGQDFSDVNVHTGDQADHLNRRLGAKAFTTGQDIFFREGAYDPGSSDGQHLIAHELTHVAQQGAAAPAVQGKMTVNDPNDRFEAEADQVADQVVGGTETAVQRQEDVPLPEDEEQPADAQLQELEEDPAAEEGA